MGKISDKPLAVYLADYIARQGTDLLEMQAIPPQVELLEVEKYRDFLDERRELLATKLNAFLGAEGE